MTQITEILTSHHNKFPTLGNTIIFVRYFVERIEWENT